MINSFPTLTDEQSRTSEAVFEEFRDKELKPAYLADADPSRALLDRRVVCDLLGFDEETYVAVRRLAAKWCAEPSVHGESNGRRMLSLLPEGSAIPKLKPIAPTPTTNTPLSDPRPAAGHCQRGVGGFRPLADSFPICSNEKRILTAAVPSRATPPPPAALPSYKPPAKAEAASPQTPGYRSG